MQWNTNTVLDNLVGHRLMNVSVSNYSSLLKFDIESTDGTGVKSYYLGTEGDCCSESWFSDIFDLQDIIGRVVTEIEDGDDDPRVTKYNFDDGRGTQESDRIYSFAIRCGDSRALFLHRNSSNGYYGGYLYNAQCNDDNLYGFTPIKSNDWKS